MSVDPAAQSTFEPVPRPEDFGATEQAPTTRKSAKPTRKLSYASATAVVLFLLSLVLDVDKETEQAVNVGLPLILAYFVKSDDTPGGVPETE